MKHLLLLIIVIPTLCLGQDTSEINHRAENRIIPPDSVVFFPDVDAQYRGGLDSIRTFVANNLEYPDCGFCCFGGQGRVYLQFYVEVDGSLSNIHVLKGFARDYDAAALACVSRMSPWIPAENQGEPVKSMVRIPIVFTLL